MKVDNAMLVNVVAREEDAFPVLRRLLTDNHEDRRAAAAAGAPGAAAGAVSLVRSGMLTRLDELDEFGRRYVLTVDLPDGLRAQPAAGALRARGLRRARPGGATTYTARRRLGRSRRCWRRRGRS